MRRLSSTARVVIKSHHHRRGTAMSELAVCLPLISLVVFGGIETADMIFLKETMQTASYEGARAAAKFNTDNGDVYARTTSVLDARHITGANIEILLPDGHTDVSQLSRGELIEVRLKAVADSNTAAPMKFYSGYEISASTYMVRE